MSDDRTQVQAEMLGNRLRKNLKHLAKWARRDAIECFRVYDADIPEVPLVVDKYLDHAHVALWVGNVAREPTWLEAMATTIASALEIPRAQVHLKDRAPQSGTTQYEKLGESGRRMTVHESGSAFLVNLDDYLDTGLFLDHRPMRAMVRATASGKDVLNLFAYTGAFSVHAAAGGARRTTTIDMSQTYCDWARDNLALNGFRAPEHSIIRADVLAWLEEPTQGQWDIVVVDPPTFSNSKRMRGTWDVQRDHVWLLDAVMQRTRPGGVVYFSTNFRKFKPAPEAFGNARAEEITSKTVPVDFRDKKIHRAWRIAV